MFAIICDKCGKELRETQITASEAEFGHNYDIKMPLIQIRDICLSPIDEEIHRGKVVRDYILCNDCMDRLYEWLDEKEV